MAPQVMRVPALGWRVSHRSRSARLRLQMMACARLPMMRRPYGDLGSARFHSHTDYRLGFYGSSIRWGGGVATIDHTPGHTLWGVVWQISVKNLEALNRQEGVKGNDQGKYRPVELSVETSSGEHLTCRSYQIIDTSQPKPPSPQYMEVLLEGAKQQGLPEEYIRELSEIQTNGFKGPVRGSRGGAPEVRAPDYRLGFYGSWSRWGGGVATIDHTPGHTLWGVVWQISVKNLEALNRQEGVKGNDQGVYRPVELSVETSSGEHLTCRSYQIIDTSQPKPPSPQYMEVLLGGARQHRLPEEYIRELSLIQTNGFKGPVQIMEDLKQNGNS
ncbi:hypothetical protein Bbelb_178630 [Branchiostoma belcheri]|nr:hypothetical protein Bbelb_178630 [Branchiostoma belcheri]